MSQVNHERGVRGRGGPRKKGKTDRDNPHFSYSKYLYPKSVMYLELNLFTIIRLGDLICKCF